MTSWRYYYGQNVERAPSEQGTGRQEPVYSYFTQHHHGITYNIVDIR